MATSPAQPPAALLRPDDLDHDLDLVESAIALVAGGGADRVALVVRDGELILPLAQASGRRSGVVVRAVWRTNGGCDIVVEPIA
jgi:hypothetical protein